MAALFGHRWTSTIPNDIALAEARDVWGAALSRLTDTQIRRGLAACAIIDHFPPSVGEFRRLAVGLPSIDECTSRVLASELNADPLTHAVYRRLGGNFMKNATSKEIESSVKREYRALYADSLCQAEGVDTQWKSPARIESRADQTMAPARPETAKKHLSQMRRILQ